MPDRTLPGIQSLQHVVVLMMENRSFDHMLGALHSLDPAIEGLTGHETNPDSSGVPVMVSPTAEYQSQLDPDPDHHFPAVDLQIFGGVTTAQDSNRAPNMQGFVKSYFNQQHNIAHSQKILNYFTPAMLPVLTGSIVPFYFSPTIGGSDINGTPMLASYPDYRFRGTNLLLFRGSIEHSLGKLPIGALFAVDEGKIGLRRDDVSLSHLRHTFGTGLTVHAGGLPVISLLFAWGGPEGNHTSATVDPALLGGSARPSLF